MNFLDDLPKRPRSHDTAKVAETAFEAGIETSEFFLIQRKDRHDYGTDYQIEARRRETMTNLRVHVQLKGIHTSLNADGSVSVTVARTNLNYLIALPDSIYICYHIPSKRLLVRYAEDIYYKYEHRGPAWRRQREVTARFTRAFDREFQRSLNERVLAYSRSLREQRLRWLVTPPERIQAMVRQTSPVIAVPADTERAMVMLTEFYRSGHDAIISRAFEQFAAVLSGLPGSMNLAYMAEINLGINGSEFDEIRVRQGIRLLQDAAERKEMNLGVSLYNQGNGWLALRDYDKARESYLAALIQLDESRDVAISAQCCKNLGSTLERLGRQEEAFASYSRALELNPDLGEAHFALSQWYRQSGDVHMALEHLDSVTRIGTSAAMSAVVGWRIELLFMIEDIDGAFREIQNLVRDASQLDWVWPWCARMVSIYGRVSQTSAHKAGRFWREYLNEHPGDRKAEREQILCLFFLRATGVTTGTSFEAFKRAVVQFIKDESLEPEIAFLWDRVGHWAQYDGDWVEAEGAHRKAYNLEPEMYGYCLGTALNFLDRHDDALPILLQQAKEHHPDAMSWFQVAVASEGVGDIEGSIAAFKRALELDPDYDRAWFNLGGIYWNSGDTEQAVRTWREAVRLFPDDALCADVREKLSLFGIEVDGNE